MDIGNIDLDALKNCLNKCLQFLKTESDDWPEINTYFETMKEDINDDKTIKISLEQHPLFKMVFT